jgi:hypothetical protein
MTELKMLPLVSSGTALTRTKADRLEVLTALINAPAFDPLFARDVIRVPGDHPVYAWLCGVPGCQRAREERHTFCKAHDGQWRSQRREGRCSIAEFLRTAKPLQRVAWQQPPACRICPDIPALGRLGLCLRHADRWNSHRKHHPGGRTTVFNAWLAAEQAFPGMGKCRVVACPDLAEHPIGLCRRHHYRYAQQGSPGGAAVPADRGRRRSDFDTPAPVACDNELAFHQWCAQAKPVCRMNGVLSLLGLPPLVKAEIQWTMFRHTLGADQGAHWPIPWIQYVADDCRHQAVNSLAGLDLGQITQRRRQVAKGCWTTCGRSTSPARTPRTQASSKPITTGSASPTAAATSI